MTRRAHRDTMVHMEHPNILRGQLDHLARMTPLEIWKLGYDTGYNDATANQVALEEQK